MNGEDSAAASRDVLPLRGLGISVASIAFGLPLIAFFVALVRHPARVRVVAAAYAASTLLALVLSEAVALWVLADGSSSRLELSITTAGLTAGGVALVVAILAPSGDGRR